MDPVTDPALHHLPVSLRNISSRTFQPPHPTLTSQLSPDFDAESFQAYSSLNEISRGPVNGHHLPSANVFAQPHPHAQSHPRHLNHHEQPDGRPQGHVHNLLYQSRHANDKDRSASGGGQYTILNSGQQIPSQQPFNYLSPIHAPQPESRAVTFQEPHPDTLEQNDHGSREVVGGHFSGMKLIENPPNLEEWRERLFNVEETITLTEEQFQTYFPHVDNIYSHRSTQRYKRKPFVSHYWDCRLKGRPPGTPKSDDPSKKKRRRTARQRDLCDVKIKITEYFPGAAAVMAQPEFGAGVDAVGGDSNTAMNFLMSSGGGSGDCEAGTPQPFGVLAPSTSLPVGHPGANGAKYYTIQRVNGNAGNDKADMADAMHKHTLAESDRVKKNSVQRCLLKEEKEKKKNLSLNQSSVLPYSGINNNTSSKRSAHHRESPSTPLMLTPQPTGSASITARRHAKPSDLQLYCNSYCPFAQRVWIAIEIKEIPYQYIEVTPSHMVGTSTDPPSPAAEHTFYPPSLLEVNPLGIVPCIRHGNWATWESGVLLEYLEDLSIGHALLPLGDPQLRAHCRLWADHINRKVLPAFYALLLASPNNSPEHPQGAAAGAVLLIDDPSSSTTISSSRLASSSSGNPPPPPPPPPLTSTSTNNNNTNNTLSATLTATLQSAITVLVNASHAIGPFFLGGSISFVDVHFAPWIIRLSRVLAYYRGWPDPEVGSRWEAWVRAVEGDERVRRTVGEVQAYHSVYAQSVVVGGGGGGGKAEMAEIEYARSVIRQEGFGLGGDALWAVTGGRDE